MKNSLRRILVSLLLLAAWPQVGALAQGGSSDVVLETTKSAFVKIDIQVNPLDVLAGGPGSVTAGQLVEEVLGQDLRYSGLFRVGGETTPADSLNFEFTIEGTVEGPLRDAGQTGEDAPLTFDLNLLTWPGRQLLLNKRYRPLPMQVRTTGHHFANQVIDLLTGEPGICLTRVVFSRGTGDRRDLYVVDFDGANLLRLTANRTLNLCPNWSPDGKEIAFTSYRRGNRVFTAWTRAPARFGRSFKWRV